MSYWLLVVDGAGAGVRRRHHAGLAACLGGACVLLTAVRYEQHPMSTSKTDVSHLKVEPDLASSAFYTTTPYPFPEKAPELVQNARLRRPRQHGVVRQDPGA